jgi:2-polyprenyl-3-methyl-5-hydroxy-6-metoxy-1,4-benzoquinol methylase
MAGTVEEHYAHHLGPIYTWMVGDLDAAFARGDAELDMLPPRPKPGHALDLGAGFGFHAIPLGRRGYSVVAMDSYEPLLRELELRKGSLPVRTVAANLSGFRAHIGPPLDVIICMGDTLTHLPSPAAVDSLFTDVAASLSQGGIFIATFRDYATAPLQGDARFIPVRSDADRVLTCFLEYAETTVTVHDLLHQRDGARWRLRVSSYPKLRLAPQWVADRLGAAGLTVSRDTVAGGMIRVTARLTG